MEENKVDLLAFQKKLHAQFEIIVKEKQLNQSSESSIIGLKAEALDFLFFIHLKDLKNISMNNNYEESKLLKSWICGYNQIRGEVFTIIDFKKLIEFIIENNEDSKYRKITTENRIIYLKDFYNEKLGIVLDDLKYNSLNEFTLLYKSSIENDIKKWKFNSEFNKNLIKENPLRKKEIEILKNISNTEIDMSRIEENYNNIYYLINDIYWDNAFKRPIYILNIENLIKNIIHIE